MKDTYQKLNKLHTYVNNCRFSNKTYHGNPVLAFKVISDKLLKMMNEIAKQERIENE